MGNGPLRVLGLDISSKFVGWAVFQDLKPVAHGLIKLGEEGHGSRMSLYFRKLTELFSTHTPTDVVIELPFSGRRKKTYGILIQYIAITLLAYYEFYQKELPDTHRLQAREIKHYLRVPKGQDHDDNKQIMIDHINGMFKTSFRFDAKDIKKKFSEDDIADAYAVVLAWLTKQGHIAPAPKMVKPSKRRKRK